MIFSWLKKLNKTNQDKVIKELQMPDILYQIGINNTNPFDLTSGDLFFLYDGNYSGLRPNHEDLMELHSISNQYVVIHMQRLDILHNGVVLKHFDYSGDLRYRKIDNKEVYSILSNCIYEFFIPNWNNYLRCYNVKNPDRGNDFDYYSNIWYDYSDCLKYAKKISKETKTTLLLTKHVESFDRH